MPKGATEMAAKRTHKRQADPSGRTVGYTPDKAKREEAETEAAVRERMEKTDLGEAARKAAQARGEVPAPTPTPPAVAAKEPVAPKVSDFMKRGKGIDRAALEAARKKYRAKLAAFRKAQQSVAVKGQKKAFREMD